MKLPVDNLVLVAVLAFYFLMVVRGVKKGLIRMTASIVGVGVSVAAGILLAPHLAWYMQQINSWVVWAETEVLPNLKLITVNIFFTALSFLIIFTAVLILINVLVMSLDRFSENGVFSVLNKTLGAILSFAEATCYVWAGMIFVQIMPHLPFCQEVSKQIGESELLTMLSENNLLISFLQMIVS